MIPMRHPSERDAAPSFLYAAIASKNVEAARLVMGSLPLRVADPLRWRAFLRGSSSTSRWRPGAII